MTARASVGCCAVIAACAARPIANAPVANVAPPSTALPVGAWRVIGCETSPGDPAPCAHGDIVFTADRVTVDVPWCHVDQRYTVVASTAAAVTVEVNGRHSVVALQPDGSARWRPCAEGRVGQLSFVRR